MKSILSIPKNIVNFFRGTISELKLVDFLSRRQTLAFTAFVLIFLVVGTLFILFVDTVFLEIRDILFSI